MAQHQTHPNWARWPGQYQQAPGYQTIDTSGMVQYGPSVPVSSPLQRHPHEHQYAMSTSYSMGSIPSMAPHNTYGVPTYTQPPTTPLAMSQRSYTEQRSPFSDRSQELSYGAREDHFGYREEQDRNPAMKCEPQLPAGQLPLPPALKQSPMSPQLSSPAAIKASAQKYENDTLIDEMMKAIQNKEDSEDEEMEEEECEEDAEADGESVVDYKGEDDDGEALGNGYQTPPMSETYSRCSTPRTKLSAKKARRLSKKKIQCDFPGCKKWFNQTTHRKIHMRKHTGEKPYACDWVEDGISCPCSFSQAGNLKTHRRRHTGEKPFTCTLCGKGFAQRGNLRAHLDTHNPNKRFHCLIEGCDKPFSQRGNLKSHQNKFHKEAVARLTEKFMHVSNEEDLDNAEDRKMYCHFKDVYRNMNKGIKGRGKGRSIKKPTGKAISHPESQIYAVQQRTPPMEHALPHQFPSVPPYPQHHPQHALPQLQTQWQSYPLARDGSYNVMMDRVPTRDSYEMYNMNHDGLPSSISSSASSATMSTPATTIYEEDHSRGLSFRDRLY